MLNKTLCFLLKNDQVYLAEKRSTKKKFGNGKLNGYGGEIKPDETIEDAVVREIYEESHSKVAKEDLQKVGVIDFYFTKKPEWNQKVHIYICKKWIDDPIESDEMYAPRLYDCNKIPLERMWDADKHWIKHVFSGKIIEDARFVYGDDNSTVIEKEIRIVSNA